MSAAARFMEWLSGGADEKRPDNGPVRRRQYENARPSRISFSGPQPSTSSADAELVTSLTTLRNRSRAAFRDNPIARNIRETFVNNIIGQGVGLQGAVLLRNGDLNKRVNDDIETAWDESKDSLFIGGRLGFADLERLIVAEVVETGECFLRLHPFASNGSDVPLSIEVIESERIVDQLDSVSVFPAKGNLVKMGVEVDKFHRPVAYYIRSRHPGESRWLGRETDQVERVPAGEIIHYCPTARWPQVRGVPMLHAVLRLLSDIEAYATSEIARARAQAASPITIETAEGQQSFAEEQADGSYEVVLEPMTVNRLAPGEKLNATPINSPNPAFDPFMRSLHRRVAVGVGLPYEDVSGDYSQSNYSSTRLSRLEIRSTYRSQQSTYVDQVRKPLHRAWLQAAVMAGKVPSLPVAKYAADIKTYQAVQFRPRGWSWVDPAKEIAAQRDAIASGFTTLSQVIAENSGGRDLEEVLAERAKELALIKEYDLEFSYDTKPAKTGDDEKQEPEKGNADGETKDDQDSGPLPE